MERALAGSLSNAEGLRILTLAGPAYEIGLAHGRLLRAEIHAGVVPLFGRFPEWDATLRRLPETQRRDVADLLDREVYAKLRRYVPQPYLDEIRGIADGSGLPEDVVFRGNLLSELTQIMARTRVPSAPTPGSGGGCTGFAVGADFTVDGELLQGKNTDYPGIGVWDRCPVLVVTRPDGGFAYVRMTSAGLLKCNTALNEHGIGIGGHLLLSDDVSPDGFSFTILENEVMREARTLRDAIGIIEDRPRAGSFAFVVSDGKTGEAAALECTGSEVSKRWLSDGPVLMTNTCTASDRQKERDLLLRGGIARNPLSRLRRIESLVDEHRGRIDVDTALAFLADHFDCASGRRRAVGHTIANIASVVSVLLRPGRREVWVGVGRVPASNNPFHGFDCADALAGRGEPRRLGRREPLALDETQLRALRCYADAAAAFDRTPDTEAPLALLRDAESIDPDEPAYPRMLGRLLLRIGRADDAAAALVRAAGAGGQAPSERAEALLLLGHAHDLAGQRVDAVAAYRAALEAGDASDDSLRAVNPLVVHAARERITAPLDRDDAARLPVSFPLLSGWE